MRGKWESWACFGVLAAAGMVSVPSAKACTRAVYFGQNGQTVTGRTMDWSSDMQTNMWILPRGMARDGGHPDGGLRWTSRYGSVITSVYEGGTADGMNEAGLVANMLYLAESVYPEGEGDARPLMSITAWAQYYLDNFATVEEAVADARRDAFRVVSVDAPSGEKGTVHVSISDASGDSAIFEFVGGELVIHHGRQYQVMTNSPVFDQQLALNAYWTQIGGTVMLPGTNRAADRFARASFYINSAEQSGVAREAVAAVFSVMRNVSVPRGISTPGQPNIASTLWRTVADQKNRVYYYEDTFGPGVLWVRLGEIDFGAAGGVRRLAMAGSPDLLGDQTSSFEGAEMFTFLASH